MQHVGDDRIADQQPASAEAMDKGFGVFEIGILQGRTIEPEGASGGVWERDVIVVAEIAGEKGRHEGAWFETDADPLAFGGTIDRSGGGLRPTERKEGFACKMCDGHLEGVGGNGEKAVCTIAVAAPDLFDEWMIRFTVVEMDELGSGSM